MVGQSGQNFQGILVGGIIGKQRMAGRRLGVVIDRAVGAIVGEAVEGYRCPSDINGKLFAGGGIARRNRGALVHGKAGMSEAIEYFYRCRINLFQA